MHNARTIALTTAVQTVLRIVEIAIGVLTLGLIARYLTPSGFGEYTTINALLQFFIIIVDFGLYLTLLREISAHEDRVEHIANSIFTMRLFATATLLVLSLILIQFTPYSPTIKMGVGALSLSFLASSLISTVTALFQKQLKMVMISFINVGNKIACLIAIYGIMSANLGLQGLLASYSIIGLLTFLSVWYALTRLPHPIRLRLHYDPIYWREVLTKTWPLAVTTALNLVYFKADTIILSLTQDQTSVGLYGASYRVLEILTTFPHMFMGLLLPLLTAAWIVRDTPKLQELWRNAFIFFASVTLPIIVGAIFVGTDVMQLVAGSDYGASGRILPVLMLATALIFFGTLYTYLVLVLDRQKAMIKYFLIVAIISLIGYLIMIPIFNYWGAAWMTVFSEALIVLTAWIVIKKDVRLAVPWLAFMKITVASSAMGLITWLMADAAPLALTLLVSALFYAACVLLLRVVPLHEMKRLILG